MKLKSAGFTILVKDFGFNTDRRLVAVKLGAHGFAEDNEYVDTFTFTTKGATMKAVNQLLKDYGVPIARIQVDQMNVVIL